MTPDQPIKTALETIEGLSGKVYPMSGLKNAAAPFVFYLQLSEDDEYTLEGSTGLQAVSFEINCVANTYASLVALAGSVRPVLQALQGTTHDDLLIEWVTIRQASPDLKEMEVNLYRRMYVLTVNYQKEEK